MKARVLGTLALACLGLAVARLAVTVAPTSAQPASGFAGIWLDDEGKGGVEIKSCGDQLCGNIVWLKQPLNPEGKPWVDLLNPDESKRSRPVCGLQIIGGLKKTSDTEWKGGWIYDPEEGKSYDVELTLKDANTLQVFGFASVRLLGETLLWKRMPNDTPRCK